jgi:predicted small metal-binding protein
MLSLIADCRSPPRHFARRFDGLPSASQEHRRAIYGSAFQAVGMSLDSNHPVTRRRCSMKQLRCGDLMPGCDTVIVGKDADEVFAKAEAHARKEHNMTIIPPSVVSQIEAAIKDRT